MLSEINNIITNLARIQYKDAPDTYLGEDGLLKCSKCDGDRQCRIEFNGDIRIVPTVCECVQEALRAEKEVQRRREEVAEINHNRKMGFHSSEFINCTFEKDDCAGSKLSEAMKRYCDRFTQFRKTGTGLILYGDVGTGKSFYAACIVNELISKGYACMMTNFNRLVSQLQSTWEKGEFLDDLTNFHLVAIDDLGVERDTSFMTEAVTTIIDALYRANVPIIVTSNYAPKSFAQEQDIKTARIYSRLLERCHPVAVTGEDRRKMKGRQHFTEMQNLLGL